MIAFILPLKPKSQSKNWKKDCALLGQTVRSLLNQSSENFNIYVVYTDSPDLKFCSQNLHLIQFPYPFLPFSEITEAESIMHVFSDKTMLERRMDKSKKILYGCKIAKEQDCTYLMSVDADDLISNKLVRYIEGRVQEEDIPGFYVSRGYLYKSGKKRMIKIGEGMQNFNGSTHILRADFVKIPDFSKGKWLDYNLFTSHGWLIPRLKELYGIELERVPFPAVIYVAHGGNISNINQLSFKAKVKQFIKYIIRGQDITGSIKEEFSLAMNELN